MEKLINNLIYICLILQFIECQYISRGSKYYHNPYRSGLRYNPNRFDFDHMKNRYDIYSNFNNHDFKPKFINSNNNNNNNNNENESPVTVEYYYKTKPLEQHWNEVRPVHKPESFVEDYSSDEYAEPGDDKELDDFKPGVSYDEDEEHHSNDYKEAAGKKFGAIDKHLESGHKEAEITKVGGFHDKHLEGRKEEEHKNFKKDGEYSHDRGHGFIKSWSWDRKNIKGNVEGGLTKNSGEISAGDKGAFGLVKAKGSAAHDKKDLSAIAGKAAYGKAAHEESDHKSSTSPGKSDFDKEFPIFG